MKKRGQSSETPERSESKHASPTLKRKPRGPAETPRAGAAWLRLDLHLHSPTVRSFIPPKETKEGDLTDAYVEQLAAQGISIGAITDYNGINVEWFEVTAAKAINRGITLLPGTELTFRDGPHLLAVFPGDIHLKALNAFLQSLDRKPAIPLFDPRGTHRDLDLRTSLVDALKELQARFNCLLILPHPDRANGLLQTMTAEAAARLLKEVKPDAVEDCPEEEKKRLQSAGVLPENFWKQLASVEFSNPKRIEEIGTRCRPDGTPRSTYLKLSTARLDALRLALHNPETRLSVGGLPSDGHPRIRGVTISGTGFLGNVSLSLNQDLNVIIGVGGAGKSALFESLRYGLSIPPFSDQSLREELVRHALGSGGSVEVLLDAPAREGKVHQYRISRALGEEARASEIGSERSLSALPPELLLPTGGPMVFGQREIYTVSENEEFRLALLDGLTGEEDRKSADALANITQALAANGRAILDLGAKQAKREEYGQRLKKVDAEIELHKKQATERLKETADLRASHEGLQNAADVVSTKLEEYDGGRLDLLGSLEGAHQTLREVPKSPPGFEQEGATVLAVLQESLKVVLDDERTLFEQAINSLARLQARCQERLHSLEEETRRIEAEAERNPQEQDRLLRWREERASLASLIAGLDKDLNGAQDRLRTLRQERRGFLQQAEDCRAGRNKLRSEKADLISESLRGRLRLTVEFKGNKKSYGERLSSFLKDVRLSQDALDRLVLPEGTDGVALANAARQGSPEIQNRFGLRAEAADSLARWLSAEESRLFELETLIPEDALRLELRVEGRYRPIGQLPADQAAAAILFLLFGLENRLLLIDQPEDYLEDPGLRGELIQVLREQKGLGGRSLRRQVILTTRDPDFPLGGDAELVIPLELRDDRFHVLGPASIDDRSMREMIKTLAQEKEDQASTSFRAART